MPRKDKAKRAEYNQQYWRLNKEKLGPRNKRYQRIYEKDNREKIRIRKARYYLTNKEKLNARNREYSKRNRVLKRDQNRRWRLKNREKWKHIIAAWRAANPERSRLIGRLSAIQRRARLVKALGRFTKSEWFSLLEKHGWRCLCCKRTIDEVRLEADHVVPLSKGGSNDIDNIQPLCRQCNSAKYDKCTDYRDGTGVPSEPSLI